MAKNYYLPDDEKGKAAWLTTFSAGVETHAATLGVTPAEVASLKADTAFYLYVVQGKSLASAYAQQWTAYKNAAARGGASLDAMPVAPILPAAPALVAPGIFTRATNLAARIKKQSGYTEAIGRNLNIIGAESTVDLNAIKPVLKLTLQAGKPNIGWTKNGMDSLEIWVDRGTGFAFLTIDSVPDYLDTYTATPGSSAAWKYKAIYRQNDEQVGQWSDVACVGVVG